METNPVNFTLPQVPLPLLLGDGSQPLPVEAPNYQCSTHMADFLVPESYRMYIDYACRALYGYEFDAIAFSGMSGALIGPPVALRLKKSMILVRKDGDDTHSQFKVEGNRNVKRYIILDDFSATGHTKDHIVSRVKDFAEGAEFLGLLSVTFISESSLRRYAGGLYPLRYAGGVNF